MNSELHIFIIWEKARTKSNELLSEIGGKFKIHDVYEIKWSKENFSNNLKRFYGMTLPNPHKKANECGTGPFLAVLVSDKDPKHGIRKTSMGKQVVNTNIYDFKRKLRAEFGGNYRIHGSIHEKEANHDFSLLLGKNLKQISQEIPEKWNNQIKHVQAELVGTDGWENLDQLFFILNNTTNYVVLRNFENFPILTDISNGGDIDILTDEKWQIPYILNFHVNEEKKGLGYCKTMIGSDVIKFDIKYVGDAYFDEKWSKEILKKRVLTKKGFYVPDKENYFFSLLYHIISQKSNLPKKYVQILSNLSKELHLKIDLSDIIELNEILKKFMIDHEYSNTKSFKYQINHNEFTRLLGVAIHIVKKEGINELLRSTKGKISRTVKN